MKLSLFTPLLLLAAAVPNAVAVLPHFEWELIRDTRFGMCHHLYGNAIPYPGAQGGFSWGIGGGAWWDWSFGITLQPRRITIATTRLQHMHKAHIDTEPNPDTAVQGGTLHSFLYVDLSLNPPIKKGEILDPDDHENPEWTCVEHEHPQQHLDCFHPKTKLEITQTTDGNITQWDAMICAFHCETTRDAYNRGWSWKLPDNTQFSSLTDEDLPEITEPSSPNTYDGWVPPGRRELAHMDACDGYNDCALCGGEPHFRTYAGEWFDFMGGCDLVLISNPGFGNGLGMDIHVRTKVRYSYSYIETAVLRIGNDLLEVDSFGTYKVNGVEGAELNKPQLVGFMEGFPIYHTHGDRDERQHVFDVVLADGQNITLTTFKDFVSVKPMSGEKYPLTNSVGILGDYNTGLMLGRNGWTVFEDPIEFGMEWQVRDTDPLLFETEDGPQYPQQCVFPDRATMDKRQLGEGGVTRDEAEAACAHHPDAEDRANCVYDVLATGDPDMAKEDYAL
jgi:hypothetical protein